MLSRQGTIFSLFVLAGAATVYCANVSHQLLAQWDDAFISFRFAQHLAAGQGLVWNLGGERVEGYTSFLHILILALGIRLGVAPENGSVALGIAAVAGTVLMLVWIAHRQFGRLHPFAAAVIGLYLIDQVTAIHTTSGLETQLFVLIVCGAYCAALLMAEVPSPARAVLLALLVFLAALTRPEGVLYGFGFYAVLAILFYRQPQLERTASFKSLLFSFGLVVLTGLGYAVWKYNYFGYLLPNPFYVKSNQLALAGWKYVGYYFFHLTLWYGLIVLLLGTLIVKKRHWIWLSRPALWLAAVPAGASLLYYLTIIHETGGAHRFSYPTYVLLIICMLVVAADVLGAETYNRTIVHVAQAACVVYLLIPIISQASWQVAPLPLDGFSTYHSKIAAALKETGLGARATVLTDAAGRIPYVSSFNQLDRIGLTDNFLSGRQPVSPQAREQYLWEQKPDVYVGYEPPASPGANTPQSDPRMRTWYVTHSIIGHPLTGIEDRIFVQDPELLHTRMRELRDNWVLIGEMEWPGWQLWQLKSFIYVRKSSPYAAQLQAALGKIVSLKPTMISLDDAP